MVCDGYLVSTKWQENHVVVPPVSGSGPSTCTLTGVAVTVNWFSTVVGSPAGIVATRAALRLSAAVLH